MSLTSDDLADIKQLMEVTIGVALERQTKYLEKRMDERFDEQDEKLDAIMNAVGVDLNEHQEQLDDHEKRIIRLEKRAA